MKCPHCAVYFQDNWKEQFFDRDRVRLGSPSRPSGHWEYRTAVCPSCKDVIIEVAIKTRGGQTASGWRQIYPAEASHGFVSIEATEDYVESRNVLPMVAQGRAM